jgi:hypothetical protein
VKKRETENLRHNNKETDRYRRTHRLQWKQKQKKEKEAWNDT